MEQLTGQTRDELASQLQGEMCIRDRPSVAQAIAAVLNIREKKPGYLEGADVLVSWCAGHLVELAAPEGYDAR